MSLISDLSSDIFSEFSESEVQGFLDEFTGANKHQFIPGKTKYVCHTTTIPFCSTFNLLPYRKEKKKNYSKEYHGYDGAHCDHHECKFCMYKRKDNTIQDVWYPQSCPCRRAGQLEEGGKLRPLCFMSVLKTFSHNLVMTEKTIDPGEVMYCQDAR